MLCFQHKSFVETLHMKRNVSFFVDSWQLSRTNTTHKMDELIFTQCCFLFLIEAALGIDIHLYFFAILIDDLHRIPNNRDGLPSIAIKTTSIYELDYIVNRLLLERSAVNAFIQRGGRNAKLLRQHLAPSGREGEIVGKFLHKGRIHQMIAQTSAPEQRIVADNIQRSLCITREGNHRGIGHLVDDTLYSARFDTKQMGTEHDVWLEVINKRLQCLFVITSISPQYIASQSQPLSCMSTQFLVEPNIFILHIGSIVYTNIVLCRIPYEGMTSTSPEKRLSHHSIRHLEVSRTNLIVRFPWNQIDISNLCVKTIEPI